MGFFNRMTNTIGTVGKNVAQMAKEATDIEKYTSQIEEHEQKINVLYLEIGKFAYENQRENACEQCMEWFSLIDTSKHTIKELSEKIRVMKGIQICSKCGAELKKGANFCNVCGERVKKIEGNGNNQRMCLNCGTMLNGNEKFCYKCGTKVEESQPEIPQDEQKKICTRCGKEIRPGDAFCKFCGTSVDNDQE